MKIETDCPKCKEEEEAKTEAFTQK